MSPSPLPPNYSLHYSAPSVPAYLHLRSSSGLSPKTEQQALPVLSGGSLFFVHITHSLPTTAHTSSPAPDREEVVAMGRVIGDGGWYYLIADIAVLPSHQRKGLGAAVMQEVMRWLRSNALDGAYVTLGADRPGRRLYERFGFRETAPATVGMSLNLGTV